MTPLRQTLLATLTFALLAVPIVGESQWMRHGGGIVSGGGGYTGPGDIVATWSAWYSTTRAFSAADRGNKLFNLCTAGDASCEDESSDATTGLVALGTIGTACVGSGTCIVKTFYDRSGSGLDVTASLSNQQVYTASVLSGINCTLFASPAGAYTSAGSLSVSQTYSMWGVSKFTGSSEGPIITSDGNAVIMGNHNSAINTMHMYGGSDTGATASDNAFHTLLGIFAGAASIAVVDGSSTTGLSAGANALSSTVSIGHDLFGGGYAGPICEAGIIPATVSSGNRTTLNSNAHTAYGF